MYRLRGVGNEGPPPPPPSSVSTTTKTTKVTYSDDEYYEEEEEEEDEIVPKAKEIMKSGQVDIFFKKKCFLNIFLRL